MQYKQKLNLRVIDLTVEQLIEVIGSEVESRAKTVLKNTSAPSYSYSGIKGIQQILNCSKSKALGMRASGILDDACIQNGNTFLIDKQRALELLKGGPL